MVRASRFVGLSESPWDPRRPKGGCYDLRKLAEGKTDKEALRALMRKISEANNGQLLADAARASGGPGGTWGRVLRRDRPHPHGRVFR